MLRQEYLELKVLTLIFSFVRHLVCLVPASGFEILVEAIPGLFGLCCDAIIWLLEFVLGSCFVLTLIFRRLAVDA